MVAIERYTRPRETPSAVAFPARNVVISSTGAAAFHTACPIVTQAVLPGVATTSQAGCDLGREALSKTLFTLDRRRHRGRGSLKCVLVGIGVETMSEPRGNWSTVWSLIRRAGSQEYYNGERKK